jgi:uncharacterized phage infection (PIP) family protein YhgE
MATRKSQQNAGIPDADQEIAKAVSETLGTSSEAVHASVESSTFAVHEAADVSADAAHKSAEASAEVAEQIKDASTAAADAAQKGADASAGLAEEITEAATTAANTAFENVSAAKDAGEDAQAAVSSSLEQLQDGIPLVHRQALDQVGAAGQSVVEGVTQMQRELASFMSTRLRHDMSVQQELLQCRSFDEVRAIQTRFLQTAIDQYSAEATKLMQMSQDMMQRTVMRNMQ